MNMSTTVYSPPLRRTNTLKRARRVLQIIPEEDERSHTPSPLPLPKRCHTPHYPLTDESSVKSRRRRANVHVTDTFHLFADMKYLEYNFPHPPLPTPSSPSDDDYDDATTSPSSVSSGLPITPSTSDDEFFALPAPVAPIRPLSVRKYSPLPLPPSPISSESSYGDSDESESEWYNRELSKILTLASPLPFVSARPESICSTVSGGHVGAVDPQREAPKSLKRRPANLSLRRPPPRSSVPEDADDNILEYYISQDTPVASSVCSSGFSFDFDSAFEVQLDGPEIGIGMGHPSTQAAAISPSRSSSSVSIVDLEMSSPLSSPLPLQQNEQQPHALRSRWSSSTLSSIREAEEDSLWQRYFKRGSMSSTKKSFTKHKRTSSSRKTLQLSPGSPNYFMYHQQVPQSPFTPTSPSPSHSPLPPRRRRSTSSRSDTESISSGYSGSSGDSSTSSGLRRKPIPVEMFLRK